VSESSSGPLDIAARVAGLLDALGLEYSIGGSVASSFSGEPRATLDIDFVVRFVEGSIPHLVTALQGDFYADEGAFRRAARDRSSANAIHLATSLKVDFFAAGGSALDDDLLARRLRVSIGSPTRIALFVHTPEDVLLQKLRWFRLGGDVSDRQWRDVLGIVRVQGTRLDADYLVQGAGRLKVSDLLARALRDAGFKNG
jgi:hypothetical protein